MKLFKYLLFIALFAGITVPLLISCSNDDDEALPIEGYWYERDGGDDPVNYAMWVFKNGKYVCVYTYKSYITKSELKNMWTRPSVATRFPTALCTSEIRVLTP